MTFAVGSEVGLQSSSDFSQMGKPFLMGTVALGETQLCSSSLPFFCLHPFLSCLSSVVVFFKSKILKTAESFLKITE